MHCYYDNHCLQGFALAVCYFYLYLSTVEHKEREFSYAYLLQSCPDAIDEVFDSKLHIIGGVGITIGVVMVSVQLAYSLDQSDFSHLFQKGGGLQLMAQGSLCIGHLLF
ncbi:hypothetical protein GOODEAATRI_008514 [Goodea atripinnis]|uniref:Uncharacterized protein n=1 Tax=Goodea atripinnis TaxID=208336 RepID=A0ABV0PWD5_9TELE